MNLTRRRWIADEVCGARAVLVGDHADHLIRVLRVRVGQEFDIVAGRAVYRARVVSISDQRVEFELGEPLPALPAAEITLVLAIIKFDRMEWAIEKCTELGVARFIPLIASRTDVHLVSSAGQRVERWRRIARQAAEQSRRSSSPEIAAPMKFKDALALPGSLRMVLSESENDSRLCDALKADTASVDVALAIGPEGGWTRREEEMFRGSGWIPASLGQTILRTETAAIAASAVVLAGLG